MKPCSILSMARSTSSQRRLVAVSERVFTDDPLRLMRAPRFAHVLGLTMGEDLTNEIRARAQELSTAAVERVVSEMCLTLGGGRSADAVRLWEGLGLLDAVLPEVRVAGGASITGLARVLSTLEHLDEILGGLRTTSRPKRPSGGSGRRPLSMGRSTGRWLFAWLGCCRR